MAGEATLGDLYYPLVAAFQWLVAALFLATGRRSAVRVAFALVLAANGLEALQFFAGNRGAFLLDPDSPVPTFFFLDKLITLTLPFLASQFPTPLGGPRGARWATRLWLAALGALTVFWASFLLPVLPSASLGLASTLVSDGAIVLAAGLLAAHTLPRALRLHEGPLRTQSLLVAAGLGLGVAYSCALFGMEQLYALAVGELLPAIRVGVGLAGGYFLGVVLARTWASAARSRRVDATLLAGGLAVGGLVGALDYLGPRLLGFVVDRPANELLTQSFRPLLFALALVRFDLFEVPARWRRPVVRFGAVVFALATFVLLVVLLSRQPLQAASVNPLPMGVALLVLAGGVLAFQRPLGEALAAGDPGGAAERRARLERYRLAFERARQDPAGADGRALEALRAELGITRAEHEALASVLEGNLVVPARRCSAPRRGTSSRGATKSCANWARAARAACSSRATARPAVRSCSRRCCGPGRRARRRGARACAGTPRRPRGWRRRTWRGGSASSRSAGRPTKFGSSSRAARWRSRSGPLDPSPSPRRGASSMTCSRASKPCTRRACCTST